MQYVCLGLTLLITAGVAVAVGWIIDWFIFGRNK